MERKRCRHEKNGHKQSNERFHEVSRRRVFRILPGVRGRKKSRSVLAVSPRPATAFRESDRYLASTDCVWYDGPMLRAIAFFGLATSAFASATLDVLVNAAASFSATIQQQREMLQSDPSRLCGSESCLF